MRKYLTSTNQDWPIDCRFDLSAPIRSEYEPLEERTTVENHLRKMSIPLVMFDQDGVWSDLINPVAFQLLKPNAPEWKKFQEKELPRIDAFLRAGYQASPPYGPYGFKTLRIEGYEEICPDIQRYLTARYKAYPSGIECGVKLTDEEKSAAFQQNGSPTFFISAYKLSYPYASGYHYQVLRLLDCTFPVKALAREGSLRDDRNLNTHTATTRAEIGEVKSTRYHENRVRRQAARKEKNEDKLESRIEKNKEKVEAIENKKTLEAMERFEKQFETRWIPQDDQNEKPTPLTQPGHELVRFFGKINQHSLDSKAQLASDEFHLSTLLDKVTVEEKKYQDMVNHKYGTNDHVLDVRLSSDEPFTIAEVPLDSPVSTSDLVKIVNYVSTLTDTWLVGCRGYSLIQSDEVGGQYPKRSKLRCMVPHILVKTKLGTPGFHEVKIPYPAIMRALKAITNHCNVLTGTKNIHQVGFKRFTLFRYKGKRTQIDDSYYALKNKVIGREIEVGGGIRGRILDQYTKLPVVNAHASIQSIFGRQSVLTDASGNYLFQTVPHRGLKMEVDGVHSKYQDGSGPITELKVAEVASQPDFYLEPRRVTVRGKVSETFHPKYGSGLKGIRVAFVGFETKLYADTTTDGSYEIKNVPASLTKVMSHDPTRGHDDGALTVDLDPEHDNNSVNLSMVPRLTVLTGKVTIPNGRALSGMTVQLDNGAVCTIITDKNGDFECKDIPVTTKTITVLPDAERIYLSNSEPLDHITAYEHNVKNVIVPYSRSDVSGRVMDIVSKTPIAGAMIWVDGGKERYHATSDQNGYYLITEVPETARVLRISTPGNIYIDHPRNIDPLPAPGKDVFHQNFNLVPRSYTKSRIVFILTWNERQWDLDSQLFFPNDMHLYYKTLNDASIPLSGGASLDRDDTGNNGRETTIVNLQGGNTKLAGNYSFLVYQYQDQGIRFVDADAQVDVYRDGEFWKQIKPGAGTGRLWYVADVSGTDVREINQFPTDIQSEIAKITASITDRENALKETKSSLVQDADHISQMAKDNETNLQSLNDAKDNLAHPQGGGDVYTALELKARKKELRDLIKALKDKIALYPIQLQKAKLALQDKEDQIPKTEEKLKADKEASLQQIKDLEKNMAMSLKNYR